MQTNALLNPSMLFFSLGLIAQLIRSDLKLPPDLIKSVTIYLLISIGIHGGVELAHAEFASAVPALVLAVLLSFCIPILAYLIIRHIGRIDAMNAVAIATHYGSVSAGTFLTAIAFLEAADIAYEKYPVIMLAVMESPAILIGLAMSGLLRQRLSLSQKQTHSNLELIRESLTNGSIVLLLGGLCIGDILPDKSLKAISPVFDQMFMGILCVFLLGMGIEAGKKLHEFKQAGLFLISFGILMPILLGSTGVFLGIQVLHYSVGGATLVGVLAASASYIAVPPAIRMAIPEATPSIYLTLSLGVTFPFNVMMGIPLYLSVANRLSSGGL